MNKIKKCLICWITCSSCRWGFCKCGMNQQQIYIANEVIETQDTQGYKKQQLPDLVKQYETIDEVITKLNIWLDEDEQTPYIKSIEKLNAKVKTNLRCEYPNMGIWARCSICWEARRDKQHALDKRCSWKIS